MFYFDTASLTNNKKVELLYLYIAGTEYKCFQNQEFNFSSKYNFHFKDRILYGEEKRYINVFDGVENLSSLTAVIGKNGVGKSTLLKFLTNLSIRSNYQIAATGNSFFKLQDGFIVVYKVGDEFIVKNFTNYSISFSGILSNMGTLEKNSISNNEKYSIENISTIYMSMEDRSDRSFKNNAVNFFPLTPSQISNFNKFFYDKTYEFENLKFKKIKFDFENFLLLYFSSNFPKKTLFKDKEVSLSIRLFEDVFDSESDFLYEPNFWNNKFINEFSIYSLLIHNLCNELNLNLKNPINVYEFLSKYFKPNATIDELTSALNDLREIINSNLKGSSYFRYFKNAIGEITTFSSDLKEINLLNIYDDTKEEFYMKINLNKLKKLLNIVVRNERSFILKYLNFDFDRSDGEIASLRHEAYLYFAANAEKFGYKKILKENVILLLDEVDVHLHPERQRTLISEILNDINDYFIGKNVQIILTSHSPLVLSDIPSSNILYLEKENDGYNSAFKDENKATFGANIFSLYNDSFYFSSNVLIGEYAKKYIDNLFNEIQSNNFNKDEIEKRINLIGEPLIKNQLLKMIGSSCEKRMNERNNINNEVLDQLNEILNILRKKQ